MTLTLEAIAQMTGVSRSTVSRVINDHPSVRPQVREQVWKVVRDSGYEPHAAARSLVTRRTQIIGVVIPEAVTKLFVDPFFPLLLFGITETCNRHNYHLMLSLFNGPGDQSDMYRRIIGGGHLDGVIVASVHMDDSLLPRLLEDTIPFVVVGRHTDPRAHQIDVDNVGGARTAVEHLIRLGHRRIATITGPLTMLSAADRLAGYRQALQANGLRTEEGLIYQGDYTESSGIRGATQLLAAQPTALFVASDVMAVGALKVLRDTGLRVPEDVAVVGFDDIPIASMMQPGLTTVRQPIQQLGSEVAELLFDLMSGSSVTQDMTRRRVLPTMLVVRDSCGARGC